MCETSILVGEEASTGYKQSVSIPLMGGEPISHFPGGCPALSLSLQLSDSLLSVTGLPRLRRHLRPAVW